MTWITHNPLIAAVAVLVLCVILNQFIKCSMLLYRRIKVKIYNRSVHKKYTQYAKETPAIILQIQNDYIMSYNDLLSYCCFLSNFFRGIGYFDGRPVGSASLLAADNPNGEEPAGLEGI